MSTRTRDTMALFAAGILAMFLVLGGGSGLAELFAMLLGQVTS